MQRSARSIRNACAFGGFFGGVLVGAALLRQSPGKGRFLLTLTLQALVLLGFALWFDRQATGWLRFGLIGAAAVGVGARTSCTRSNTTKPSAPSTHTSATPCVAGSSRKFHICTVTLPAQP